MSSGACETWRIRYHGSETATVTNGSDVRATALTFRDDYFVTWHRDVVNTDGVAGEFDEDKAIEQDFAVRLQLVDGSVVREGARFALTAPSAVKTTRAIAPRVALKADEKGVGRFEAARGAVSEIALAVLATTLSLVVIFVPVAFTGGHAAESTTRTFLVDELPAWMGARDGPGVGVGPRAILGISFGAKDALDVALASAESSHPFNGMGLIEKRPSVFLWALWILSTCSRIVTPALIAAISLVEPCSSVPQT